MEIVKIAGGLKELRRPKRLLRQKDLSFGSLEARGFGWEDRARRDRQVKNYSLLGALQVTPGKQQSSR